ncbi:PhoP regulatory network YrbL family protein [Agrobacterium tumefaciens]|uniref:PhoP regulatory network YrbL family protein n=1 Tax=Agrobacterium tumefaciens TaxID=358 RepID=UPI0021D15981|nr:PhoP regulatory network YrbL family protein [Agrobacterium tumefaciens]UXS03748.1 hypothetical protein FY156_19555 [Agrobacterium tumefaciens]
MSIIVGGQGMLASSVKLADKPIAKGMSRELYALPGTDLIVKVQAKEPPPRRYFQRVKLLAALRRFYKTMIPLRRELHEYERASREGMRTARHLQRFAGLVQTDKGTGLVVQPVTQKNGSLAMTLDQTLETGRYDAKTDAALNEFLDWFVKSGVVAADVHLKNIVLDEKSNTLVLIDGIGDKTFLPVRAWFPRLNTTYKKRLAQAIYTEVAFRFLRGSLGKQTIVLFLMFAGTLFGIDILDGHLIDG